MRNLTLRKSLLAFLLSFAVIAQAQDEDGQEELWLENEAGIEESFDATTKRSCCCHCKEFCCICVNGSLTVNGKFTTKGTTNMNTLKVGSFSDTGNASVAGNLNVGGNLTLGSVNKII
jgi:hypothetical protein